MKQELSLSTGTPGQFAVLHWYHWAVVVGSLLLTLSAWQVTRGQLEQKQASQFERHSDQVLALIRERMSTYEDALNSGYAFFRAQQADPEQGSLTRDSWRAFAQSLSIDAKYPGINGLGFIHFLTEATLPDYLSQQQMARPGFRIHPAHGQHEFWPITYIEPEALNQKAVGLDMAHERHRYQAARAARDLALSRITAPIVLVQDQEQTPGFLFFKPVYTSATIPTNIESRRQQFAGLIYAPFIMRNLMVGTLKRDQRLVQIRIRDELLDLYSEYDSNQEFAAAFQQRIMLPMYGRDWQVDIISTPTFEETYSSHLPLAILAGGLTIDGLLLSLLLLMASSNRRTTLYADRVSRELRQREAQLSESCERLQHALGTMGDGLFMLDEEAHIIEINDIALKLFQQQREEALGAPAQMLLGTTFVRNILDSAEVRELAVTVTTATGATVPVLLRSRRAHYEGRLIYTCIVRDQREQRGDDLRRMHAQVLYESLVSDCPVGLGVLNAQGNWVLINDTVLEWLQTDREAFLRGGIEDFITAETRASWARLVGGGTSARVELQPRGGSRFCVQMTRMPIHLAATEQFQVLYFVSDHAVAYSLPPDLWHVPTQLVSRVLAEVTAPLEHLLIQDGVDSASMCGVNSEEMLLILRDRLRSLQRLTQVTASLYDSEVVAVRDRIAHISAHNPRLQTLAFTLQERSVMVPLEPFDFVLEQVLLMIIERHPVDPGVVSIVITDVPGGFSLALSDDHMSACAPPQATQVFDSDIGQGAVPLLLSREVIERCGGTIRVIHDQHSGFHVSCFWPTAAASSDLALATDNFSPHKVSRS